SLSRFDRVIPSQGAIYLAGKARPQRLHQEDFCQALGLQSWQKYEAATDDRYANMMVSLIAKASVNPFGERLQLLDYLTVNYLLGNCDGHLKNYSLVESLSDQTAHLSPMYDVCSTTVYPELDRRMGISISPHGLIDTVTQSSTHELVRWVGLPDAIAIPQIRNAVMGVLPAIEASRDKITHMGFPRVSKVADKILSDVRPRVDKLSTL
uniref:HipA domain-containing protein n=1 Tax=Parafannyhessea umbonata TaxID=604330 RepID=UPI003AB5D442